jgi:hypothetical protein
MGRPIKKQYFGNVSASGQQIIGNAWINGDTVARPSWIVKQLSVNSHVWQSVDGQGPSTPGQCYLVNGPVTGPGQANISIYPFGVNGSGATGEAANLAASTATVVSPGASFSTDTDYGVGNVLNVSGGTYTTNYQANVLVTSVMVRVVAPTNNNPGTGTNYSVGDTFVISGADYTISPVIRVTQAGPTGGVRAAAIVTPGCKVTPGLPADPVTFTSQNTINANASGATFNISWGVLSLVIANAGDYSALPANPVTLLGAGGGATANLTYSVGTVVVTDGGSGFDSTSPNTAAITFDPAGANAVGVINAAGSVSSVTINSGGGSYTTIPTITIAPSANPSLVSEIMDSTVRNFNNTIYSWRTNGNQLPGPGWAYINTN